MKSILRLVCVMGVLTFLLGTTLVHSGQDSLAFGKSTSLAGSNQPMVCPSTGCNLDVILQGPLVISEYPNEIRVLEPKLDHHRNPRFGALQGDPSGVLGSEFDEKGPGTYNLLGPSPYSGKINPINPVANTDVLTAALSTGKVTATCDQVRFCLRMPRPDQIVPWNADPMVISDHPVDPHTQPEARYSTLIMLRYTGRLRSIDDLMISDNQQRTFKPKVKIFGARPEVLLAVFLLPEDGYATHEAASTSYEAMVKLVSNFKSYLQFLSPVTPPTWPMRNNPLNPDSLPYEVIAHLAQYTDTDLVSVIGEAKNLHLLHQFYPHANCKVPILRVTDAK